MVFTHRPIFDQACIHPFTKLIHTLEEFTSKELNADDTEDQPEDEADDHDVEDWGNGFDQSVYDHLQ